MEKYLRREFPCVLFKANTQNQNSNLSSNTIFNTSMLEKKEFIEEMLSSNKAVGAENLLNLLKNYCRNDDIKKQITVGIVGFPNVGKSSIINSLKRGKVVGVSSTPGYTKGLQEIHLDRNIKLIDCPGVVFSSDPNEVILHNVIRTQEVKDPIEIVAAILNKIAKELIIEEYKLESDWETIEQFLYFVGAKLNKYKKVVLFNIGRIS
jgi:nuclear GTP-binding protein